MTTYHETPIQCPMCDAEQPYQDCTLGSLGHFEHFRCRYCGWQWSDEIEVIDNTTEYPQ
jgi:transposase-like protein